VEDLAVDASLGPPPAPDDTLARARTLTVTDPLKSSPPTPGAPRADQTDAAPDGADSRPDITPERLREILGRIESGFYDRAEIRDEVARRAARDLDAE
jgi:hypothetical protein